MLPEMNPVLNRSFSISGPCVVTGAAGGIGLAITRRFLRLGAHVIMLDSDDRLLQRAAQRLKAESLDGAEQECCDVRDCSSLVSVMERVRERHGGLQVLVNCAGVSKSIALSELDETEWDRVLDINLKGTFLACKAAWPMLTAGPGKSIVNISSVVVKTGGQLSTPHYTASKGGVEALTRALARDGAKHGLRVNAVAPGLITTPMTTALPPEWEKLRQQIPLGRLGQPEDVAWAVAFLASELAAYITGAVIPVNGGFVMG